MRFLQQIFDWINSTAGAWQAIFALCLVITAGLQILWMRKTVGQMKADGKQRDDFDKIKLRARVNINISNDNVTVTPHKYPGFFYIRVNPIISNDGETAADSMNFFDGFHIQPINISPPDVVIEADIKALRENGHDFIIDFGDRRLTNSLGKGVAREVIGNQLPLQIKDLREGEGTEQRKILVYSGFIKYRDVFKDVWIRKFAWQINLNETWSGVSSVFLRRNEETKEDNWPKDH